jgi:dienelactone hydrolase
MQNNSANAARQIVEQMAQGNFATVEQQLASNIRPLLPQGRLQSTWQTLEQQVGPFKEQVSTQAVQMPQGTVQIVTCAFEKMQLDINITFNGAGEISSLSITPQGAVEQQVNTSYDPPPYARLDQFHEEEVQVGQGEWALPGTLSIPRGTGPFKGIVLVHGSGPNDRDETIPPNKPLRDLAWGLASQGIVVLRYDKRTKVYGAKVSENVSTFTVKEEVIDDARAALTLLRGRAEVEQVFLLGHSLGGYLAPRIAAADAGGVGLIMLAAIARPLEDVILDQISYILSLNTTSAEEQAQQIVAIKEQVARVKAPGLSPATPPTELPLGVSAAYWLDLRNYHPIEVARTLKQPMFILQAESDYQTTMEDFQMWREALASSSNVQFKSYSGLYHLFMLVEGGQKATPAAYTVPGHVVEEVINDIGRWIKQQ